MRCPLRRCILCARGRNTTGAAVWLSVMAESPYLSRKRRLTGLNPVTDANLQPGKTEPTYLLKHVRSVKPIAGCACVPLCKQTLEYQFDRWNYDVLSARFECRWSDESHRQPSLRFIFRKMCFAKFALADGGDIFILVTLSVAPSHSNSINPGRGRKPYPVRTIPKLYKTP
jgi:hypothetical protein